MYVKADIVTQSAYRAQQSTFHLGGKVGERGSEGGSDAVLHGARQSRQPCRAAGRLGRADLHRRLHHLAVVLHQQLRAAGNGSGITARHLCLMLMTDKQ